MPRKKQPKKRLNQTQKAKLHGAHDGGNAFMESFVGAGSTLIEAK
jgi:hypothetical protein